MPKERKIAAVVKKSSPQEAADSYLFFWADKNIKQRFEELLRLKKITGHGNWVSTRLLSKK